jgi:hypothetical protein
MMLVTQSDTMSLNVTSVGLNPGGASSMPSVGSRTALRAAEAGSGRVRGGEAWRDAVEIRVREA